MDFRKSSVRVGGSVYDTSEESVVNTATPANPSANTSSTSSTNAPTGNRNSANGRRPIAPTPLPDSVNTEPLLNTHEANSKITNVRSKAPNKQKSEAPPSTGGKTNTSNRNNSTNSQSTPASIPPSPQTKTPPPSSKKTNPLPRGKNEAKPKVWRKVGSAYTGEHIREIVLTGVPNIAAPASTPLTTPKVAPTTQQQNMARVSSASQPPPPVTVSKIPPSTTAMQQQVSATTVTSTKQIAATPAAARVSTAIPMPLSLQIPKKAAQTLPSTEASTNPFAPPANPSATNAPVVTTSATSTSTSTKQIGATPAARASTAIPTSSVFDNYSSEMDRLQKGVNDVLSKNKTQVAASAATLTSTSTTSTTNPFAVTNAAHAPRQHLPQDIATLNSVTLISKLTNIFALFEEVCTKVPAGIVEMKRVLNVNTSTNEGKLAECKKIATTRSQLRGIFHPHDPRATRLYGILKEMDVANPSSLQTALTKLEKLETDMKAQLPAQTNGPTMD